MIDVAAMSCASSRGGPLSSPALSHIERQHSDRPVAQQVTNAASRFGDNRAQPVAMRGEASVVEGGSGPMARVRLRTAGRQITRSAHNNPARAEIQGGSRDVAGPLSPPQVCGSSGPPFRFAGSYPRRGGPVDAGPFDRRGRRPFRASPTAGPPRLARFVACGNRGGICTYSAAAGGRTRTGPARSGSPSRRSPSDHEEKEDQTLRQRPRRRGAFSGPGASVAKQTGTFMKQPGPISH